MATEDDGRSHRSAKEPSIGDSSPLSTSDAARSLGDSPFETLLDKGRQLGSPSSARQDVAPLTPLAVKRIPAGESPHSVAVSPDGRHIYVTNFHPGTVSIVDPNLEEIVATIKVVENPYGVAARPDGRSLNVTSPGSKRVDRVIIPGTATPMDVDIQTGISHAPYGIAISQDGGRLYVALALEDAILILDAFAKQVNEPLIGSMDFPVGVALSPDGGTLYASSYFHAAVRVVDLARGTVVRKLDVALNPYGLAVSKDGGRLYVTHFPDGNVSVVDVDSNAAVATIPVEDGPRGIAISPDGRHLYVTNMFADSVSVITL
jgi:YVTN family beta-propeller protein